MPKLLLIDDEDAFRISLSRRLKMRGYENIALNSGADAVKTVRSNPDIDVVVLDRKMPGMSGEQVLKEIKTFRPELQVIMLTGHSSTESAVESGRLDAFSYLEKPCELEKLISVIDEARENVSQVMARHEIPYVEKKSLRDWLVGTHTSRPGFIILGILIFLAVIFMPAPKTMMNMLSFSKTGEVSDTIQGFADYSKMEAGESISDYYSLKYKIGETEYDQSGKRIFNKLTPGQAAFRAKVVLGMLAVAALYWATGALPIGITALLVGVFMYFFNVLNPDDIARAYAKDAVIFIFGVLAFASAITKTGLDRRIGLLLLGPAKTIRRYLFIFLPMVAVACSFLSEHALVAFTVPVLLFVYVSSTQAAGIKVDRNLAIVLMLTLTYAANSGGPGSPAAGGRNAVMLGILSDYGIPMDFGQWVIHGLPFVPVMAFVIGLYFYFAVYSKVKVKDINVTEIAREASKKIGPMTQKEYITAAVLLLLITLWITTSSRFGMGGPVILALVLLNVFRIINWRDISKIHWEVVALYASAAAMGKGIAVTGVGLFLAQSFVNILPDVMKSGEGLTMAVSFFTGITTNFMSDGATVAAIGPITVPMATISGTHPWMIGLATAFASSFANLLIIGTPNNAIVYSMAKDPITGEQLVTLTDFLKHGCMILLLNFLVLWGWIIFTYWRWVGF